MDILSLYPQRVFFYFSEIAKIPRGSGNEKQISDYLVNFAKNNGLYVYQDEYNNVLIRKPASSGYEKYKSIALQGHIDMVCEKNKDVEFDFVNDPIKLLVKDGFLTADGTTLGADNGISVAITLAILESDEIKHPKLEVLMTTDEEAGMSGAYNFDITKLESDIIVNIDSEDYGCICVSSAGGIRINSEFDVERENISIDDKIYNIELNGLKGGHSGIDINSGAANSTKIIAEMLRRFNIEYDMNIVKFASGSKDNTIPREASVTITTDATIEEIKKSLQLSMDSLNYEYYEGEKNNMKFFVQEVKNIDSKKLTEKSTRKLIEYINGYNTGVIRMSDDIENLVETSINLGIFRLEDKVVKLSSLIRSSITKSQEDYAKYVEKYGNKFNARTYINDSYSSWEYKKDSDIREHFLKIFKDYNGEDAKIIAIHAGLECGIFAEKIPTLILYQSDQISKIRILQMREWLYKQLQKLMNIY